MMECPVSMTWKVRDTWLKCPARPLVTVAKCWRRCGAVMKTTVCPTDHVSMNTAEQSEWLTAEEAAAYLKVKTRSLLRWVRLGNVQAYTLSGTRRHVWRFR